MKQYSLSALQAFVTVVETNSFHQASERLHTSPASVSRRVSQLEDALGTRLLNRTTRKTNLTDVGEQYYHDIQNVFDALQEAEERVCEVYNEITGPLKIAAPMSFGVQVIAPLIPKFMQKYPSVTIDLQLEDHQTDLISNGIDLALRIGELKDSSLVATKLGNVGFGYYASPDYLKMHGEPMVLEDLADHECLHYNHISFTNEWGIDEKLFKIPGKLSVNNGEVLCEAAIQNQGIVSLPNFIVKNAIKEKKLKEILVNKTRVKGLYAMRLSRNFTPKKIRLLIDFLKKNISTDFT